jgi:RecA-family ATPase
VAVRYFCSLPNRGEPGHLKPLMSNDPQLIAGFCKGEDRPGRGVYECVNPLLDNASGREIASVAAIAQLHVDIDFKDVEEPADEIDRRLQQLPEPPGEVRNSGGGRHVFWHLREPIPRDDPDFERACALLKRLAVVLCGDMAPTHPAALLRVPGTHNTKRGEPVKVETLWARGDGCDLGDVESMLDLLQDAPLFTRKNTPVAASERSGEAGAERVPVDVDARLAAMAYLGPGDSAIHPTQLHCMGSLVRSGLSLDMATEVVLDATRQAVAADPRCGEWDWGHEEQEIWRMGADLVNKHPELSHTLPDELCTKFEEARRAGKRVRVSRNGAGPHVRVYSDAAAHALSASAVTATGAVLKMVPPAQRVTLSTWAPLDPRTVPPREQLYGHHYQRGVVSATVAPGGVGKSSVVLVEFLAMATCRNLLAEQPTERCRVWIHNGEDNLVELHRRILAICQHYRIPQTELEGWLFVTSGAEMPLKIARGYSDLKLDDSLLREIAHRITENQIDACAFDPLVMLHDSAETGNDRMDTVVRAFASIANACDCAIDLSHHTRKLPYGAVGYTADDARGPSALRDAVRALRVLNPMTEKEATDSGIGEMDRLRYFRVDRGKANYAAPASAVTWRKFESIDLPNGDNVGVITEWTPPGQGMQTPERAAAEQKADEVFLRLLDKFIAQGRNVGASKSAIYAPALFAEEREAKAAKVSRAALKGAMQRLLDAGRIKLESSGRSDRATKWLVPWHGGPK